MAKKKQFTDDDPKDDAPSIGSQMKSKLTQRDRNLAIKDEMIARGERDEPKAPGARTQRERNLLLKNQNKESKSKDDDKQGKSKK